MAPVEPIGVSTFKEVFEAVEKETCKYGLIPIENSVSGTLHVMYDHLIRSNLHIVGECAAIEHHCLCVVPGTNRTDVVRIFSHPVILEQCEAYINALEMKRERPIQRVASWDSSGACADVKAPTNASSSAAIASRTAAEYHKLEIIEEGIGNELNNETRYLILAAQATPRVHSSHLLKSSIAIAAPNEPGALFKIVAAFALRNLSVLKIESRPASTAAESAGSRHWDYIFYVDYEPSSNAKTNQRLVENLKEHALWIRELGHYCQNLTPTAVEEPRWHQVQELAGYS